MLGRMIPILAAYETRFDTLLPIESELLTLHQEILITDRILLDGAAAVGKRCHDRFFSVLWSTLERSLFDDETIPGTILFNSSVAEPPSNSRLQTLSSIRNIVQERGLEKECLSVVDKVVRRMIATRIEECQDVVPHHMLRQVGSVLCDDVLYASTHYCPVFEREKGGGGMDLLNLYMEPVFEFVSGRVEQVLKGGGTVGEARESTTDEMAAGREKVDGEDGDDVIRGISMRDGIPMVQFLAKWRTTLESLGMTDKYACVGCFCFCVLFLVFDVWMFGCWLLVVIFVDSSLAAFLHRVSHSFFFYLFFFFLSPFCFFSPPFPSPQLRKPPILLNSSL